jgi:hypothetical protein
VAARASAIVSAFTFLTAAPGDIGDIDPFDPGDNDSFVPGDNGSSPAESREINSHS